MRHIENVREARGLDRLRGLSATAPGEPLHIPRCRSVHTFGMRLPLDLVWLDGDGSIVRVDRAVPPRRVRTCLRARSVVEAPAGTLDLTAGGSRPPRAR